MESADFIKLTYEMKRIINTKQITNTKYGSTVRARVNVRFTINFINFYFPLYFSLGLQLETARKLKKFIVLL